MKEIGTIKNYSIYEFRYKYRVYYTDQFGEHLEYIFDKLSDAIDYIKKWLK